MSNGRSDLVTLDATPTTLYSPCSSSPLDSSAAVHRATKAKPDSSRKVWLASEGRGALEERRNMYVGGWNN